jgi:transposase
MDDKKDVETTVREIRRKTRKKYSAEEKIRVVLEGLRGESAIAELCRREGIHPNMYYKWSKEFLEAGKQRLTGDTQRQADNQEVQSIRTENEQLKQLVGRIGEMPGYNEETPEAPQRPPGGMTARKIGL